MRSNRDAQKITQLIAIFFIFNREFEFWNFVIDSLKISSHMV